MKSQMAFVRTLGSHRTAPRTLAKQQELLGTTERAPAELHPVTEDLDNPKASIRLFLRDANPGEIKPIAEIVCSNVWDPVGDLADMANALCRGLHGAVEIDGDGTGTVVWLSA